MAGRARKPLPQAVKINYNFITKFYEGEEGGITYQLTYEQLSTLKEFFHLRSTGYEPRITTWYNSLSRYDKPKVKRIGAPQQPDDFTPDPEPNTEF